MNKHVSRAIALITIFSFSLYTLTDILELITGRLSNTLLIATYIAMSLIPISVMGVYFSDTKNRGLLYFAGLTFIGYSFIYFASTALYGLFNNVHDYSVIVKDLGFSYIFHGLILVIGGLIVSIKLFIKKNYTIYAAVLLFFGSLLSCLNGLFSISDNLYVAANFFRNISFVIIGVQILKNSMQKKII